jgi:hypothetical protein
LKRRNADLARELQSDLDLEEEEQREKGLPPEEARYAARRAFRECRADSRADPRNLVVESA